jgi:uncharacterized phage protein (TIGR01671 family)
MKREIIFRGQRIDTGEWVQGWLIQHENKKIYIIWYDSLRFRWIKSEVNPITLGQYIGINDKNGKMIFEGDILLDYEIDLESQQDISGYEPVVWDSASCSFVIDVSFKKDGSCFENLVEYFGIDNLEVVGNIYNNPELL